MRLNGIHASKGTLIDKAVVTAACHCDFTFDPCWVGLEKATGLDLLRTVNQEPRSTTEHNNLRRIRTVYGMARTFNPATKGLGPVQSGSYLDKLRMEKKVKVARRRNQAELRHLYRLREGK